MNFALFFAILYAVILLIVVFITIVNIIGDDNFRGEKLLLPIMLMVIFTTLSTMHFIGFALRW